MRYILNTIMIIVSIILLLNLENLSSIDYSEDGVGALKLASLFFLSLSCVLYNIWSVISFTEVIFVHIRFRNFHSGKITDKILLFTEYYITKVIHLIGINKLTKVRYIFGIVTAWVVGMLMLTLLFTDAGLFFLLAIILVFVLAITVVYLIPNLCSFIYLIIKTLFMLMSGKRERIKPMFIEEFDLFRIVFSG